MTWADPGGLYVHYYSYFSDMPLGYGNWMPILTTILVIGATIMLLFQIIKPDISDKWSRRTLNCLILAVIFSLISTIVFNTTTALSGIITGMILLAAMLQYFSIIKTIDKTGRVHMFLFNKCEVYMGHSFEESAKVRSLLSAHDIPYQIKVRSHQGQWTGRGAVRSFTGNTVGNLEQDLQTAIYVKKADYEKAMHIVRQEVLRRE